VLRWQWLRLDRNTVRRPVGHFGDVKVVGAHLTPPHHSSLKLSSTKNTS
jgi:hypothetical protein